MTEIGLVISNPYNGTRTPVCVCVVSEPLIPNKRGHFIVATTGAMSALVLHSTLQFMIRFHVLKPQRELAPSYVDFKAYRMSVYAGLCGVTMVDLNQNGYRKNVSLVIGYDWTTVGGH